MDDQRLYFVASDVTISTEKTNDIFLCVEMRMLSTRANRNDQGVTEAFIDEIIANPETYECLPLYVDIDKLKRKQFNALGHMLNRMSGEFKSTQVGGMRNFRKVEDEYGISLVGEARIPKREALVCQRVMELYEMGALNFSFEIRYVQADTVIDNGVTYVDASENNVLTGMAIVSVPAYAESVALNLVAEAEEMETSDADEGDEKMDEAENKVETEVEVAEQIPAEETVVAESEVTENVEAVAETEVVAEEAVAEEAEEKPEETEDEKPDEGEVAEAACGKEDDKALAEQIESLKAELEGRNAEFADLQAAHAAVEAEIAQLRAERAQLDAQMEALYAEHAELEAIRAAREAEALMNKQNTARAFAEKQGLDSNDEAVAQAIAELDYAKIAELSMAGEPVQENITQVTVASYGVVPQMQIKGRFDRVLARSND